jgi:hypothetical protein
MKMPEPEQAILDQLPELYRRLIKLLGKDCLVTT